MESKSVSITVNPNDAAAYEQERLKRAQWWAKTTPTMSRAGKWTPPKLNEDGSLTDEEQEKARQKVAGTKEAWGGEAKKA